MPFAHIFVDAEQNRVIEAIERGLAEIGLRRVPMTPELNPRRAKELDAAKTRLFWISPRLGRWTGIFEYRYYGGEARDRWGISDERLAVRLSRELPASAWRMEVIDNAGFWLWNHFEAGEELEGGAYEDDPSDRSTDPSHKRYALNRIIEREGFSNIGLGYENIPGANVTPIENIPQSHTGIEGYEGFAHAAFAR